MDRIHQCLGDDAKARAEEAKHADTLMLLASLTPREREVMTLIVDGNSNKQIARILDISPKTVEVHRAHIMEKIKANSVVELVQMAIACGLGNYPESPTGST